MAAPAKGAPMRPTCGTCPCYEPRVFAVDVAAQHGVDTRGNCHFLPAIERKWPDDWCAQHPDARDWLAAQRKEV